MTRNAGCGEETKRDALLPRAQSGSRRLRKPEDASLEAILAAFVSGDHRSVVALSGEVIRQSPTCAFAWKALGSAQLKLGQHEEAVRALGTATELDPSDAEAHSNLGNAEMGLGKLESALARYDRALQLKPDHPEALNNRGVAGHRSGRAAEALADFDRALELDPGYVEAWHNRGSTLRGLGRLEEALASHDRGLTLRSDSHEAHAYRGRVLQDLSRFDEALASYAEALRIRPDFASAQHDRANVLVRLGRLIEAVAGFDQVLAGDARAAGAWNDRGTALLGLRRFDEALDNFGKALDLRPGFATACFNRGVALRLLGRLDEALASMREARRLDDSGEFFAGEVLGTAMRLCAWEGVEEEAEQLRSDILAGKRASTPFPTLALLDDPLTHLKAAQTWASARHPIQQPRPPLPAPHPQAKIRIGYYSADFHNHATAYLIAGLLEAHDTSQFEIHAFSFGPHSNDPMRSRITNSVSQFLDVSLMSDTQVAQLSRQTGIDIAIDLKGFTMDSRPGIFAAGCAPIQVSYLGYPGSMGCNFIDYIIADHTTIPISQQHLYSEKIIRLPHTYQANDNKRSIANSSPSRQDANLPDNAFVFCCFNNNYKILPSTFKLWMLILKAVPNSVLWLLEDNPWAKDNLRKQATLHNINPNRLVFAKRLKLDQHLARHQLANLFLDTFPYNAHTTASDALWAGLPLLTRQGQSFASRVAASLLNSLNLPQLITHSPSQYLQTAIQLANNPNTLSSLRKQLLQNQLTTPLFNTTLFTKNLELAYQQIQQHSRSTTTKHINIVATNPPQNPGYGAERNW